MTRDTPFDKQSTYDGLHTLKMTALPFEIVHVSRPLPVKPPMSWLLSPDHEDLCRVFSLICERSTPASELEIFGMAFSGYAHELLMTKDPLIGLLALSTDRDSATIRPEVSNLPRNDRIIESSNRCAYEIALEYPDLMQRFSDSVDTFVIPTAPQRDKDHPLGLRSPNDVQIVEDFLSFRRAVENIGESPSLEDTQEGLAAIGRQNRLVAYAISGLFIRSDNPNLVIAGAKYIGEMSPLVAMRAMLERAGLLHTSPSVQQAYRELDEAAGKSNE